MGSPNSAQTEKVKIVSVRPSYVDCVEFNWDERTEIAEFIYEDDRTGELSYHQQRMPLAKPEATEELRYNYFNNLSFWLKTQPLYD